MSRWTQLTIAIFISSLTCFTVPGMFMNAMARAENDPHKALVMYSKAMSVINSERRPDNRKVCDVAPCPDPLNAILPSAKTARPLSPGAEPLRYDSLMHKWSFSGTVLEVRPVFIMGLAAQVARVRVADFDAWVILRMASQSTELGEIVLEKPDETSTDSAENALRDSIKATPNDPIGVGDQVRVSISGAHVSKTGVDWGSCQPIYSNYCRQGGLYDIGPLSGDWNVPLSPSNELIHSGWPNPSWEFALYWNTEQLNLGDSHTHQHQPQSNLPACLALRKRNPLALPRTAPDDASCFSGMVKNSILRANRERQP